MELVYAIIVLVVVIFLLFRHFIAHSRRFLAEQAGVRSAEQAQQLSRILEVCNESIAAFESIPKDLMSAEQLLDTAETEFLEGAFSPFWDSIERATSKLGEVDARIEFIADRTNRYETLVKSYGGSPPPFPISLSSVRRLVAVTTTVVHLHKIVSNAQRNFQFATIYEQRKTNKILIAGFAGLAEAIHGVGTRLEQSIGELSSRTVDMSLAIKSADRNLQAAMTEQAARQEKANRMLDNIQRRRVPPPLTDY